MTGFGLMRGGLTPFGLGTPSTGAATPTGAAGSRYLDPITRDYGVDSATGQFKQMPGVRQRVEITVLTTKRSSTGQPLFGVELPARMDEHFEADSRASIAAALRQLIEIEKVMRLDAPIKVEKGNGGRARFTISFTDLTTGQSQTISGP